MFISSQYTILVCESSTPTKSLNFNSFINRFLLKPDVEIIPKDVKRLRISGLESRRLLSHFEVPPTFLSSLLSQNLPPGLCSQVEVEFGNRSFSNWCYTIPIRAAIPCTENERSHALSAAGSNQMNPSQYLHLHACGVDVRPSKIVILSHHSLISHSTSIICIDFQDGRWHEIAEEPTNRAREAVNAAKQMKRAEPSIFMHVVMLSSATRWWRTALESFNDQLIHYVSAPKDVPRYPAKNFRKYMNDIAAPNV